MPRNETLASEIVFEEVRSIFLSTEAMGLPLDERLRLCASAAVTALVSAGLISDSL